jgi:hypothetical protein
MILGNSARFPRHRMAAIVATVVFTIALVSAGPPWAAAQSTESPPEDPGPSPVGACTPGQLVNFCGDVSPAQGFLLDKGVFTTIIAQGASYTGPSGINNRGQIVGVVVDTEGRKHGLLLDEGVFTIIDVDVPDAAGTQLLRINDRRQMVGAYGDADGATHGFLREKDGDFTTIDLPGASATLPFGINDRGRIVGIGLLP